ncbi:MAG: preprotein translocase subunit YajC [Deltaproteobacteria bacterium]|nr:preprotein translocase subunit YajC [Deltaproteobacteria bacterium]
MLDWLTTSTAWAMGAGQQGGGGEGAGGLGGLLSGPIPMLVLMFVIFYFLLIRPQQKKAKAHKAMLGAIKKGDKILTNGGIYGRVTGLDDQTLTLEIAPQVRIKVSRGHIAGVVGATGAPPAPAPKK